MCLSFGKTQMLVIYVYKIKIDQIRVVLAFLIHLHSNLIIVGIWLKKIFIRFTTNSKINVRHTLAIYGRIYPFLVQMM